LSDDQQQDTSQQDASTPQPPQATKPTTLPVRVRFDDGQFMLDYAASLIYVEDIEAFATASESVLVVTVALKANEGHLVRDGVEPRLILGPPLFVAARTHLRLAGYPPAISVFVPKAEAEAALWSRFVPEKLAKAQAKRERKAEQRRARAGGGSA